MGKGRKEKTRGFTGATVGRESCRSATFARGCTRVYSATDEIRFTCHFQARDPIALQESHARCDDVARNKYNTLTSAGNWRSESTGAVLPRGSSRPRDKRVRYII